MDPALVLAKVVEIVRTCVGKPCRVYLFGSRATSMASPGSDFDILIDAGSKVAPNEWRRLLSEIESLPTLRSIDLVDRHDTDPEFLRTIESDLIDVTESSSSR